MRPYATIGSLLLPLVILLAGRPARADEPPVSLELKGHHFTPTGITIPANTRVRFLVKNLDPTPAEFESDDFPAEKVVPSGQQVTIFVGPLKPGTYEFHDEYNEDVSKTHLVVK
jgi:plastocyanin domain-containing protein